MEALFDRPIDDSGWARLRRHGRLWRRCLTLAVVREAQFRAHFVATVVVGLAQVAVALIPILLIFNFTSAVHGWSQADLIVLLGIHQLVSALLATFIAPNVTRMTEYITHGDLDLMLIRPVDAQFYVTFRWLQPAEAFNVAIGIGLVVVGLARAGEMPGLVAIGQGVVLLICGVILLTCAWSATAFCIFWVSSLHLGMTIFYDVMDAGRYPVVFYPWAIRAFLTFAVPWAVATTLPAQALTGSIAWWVVPGAVAFSGVALVLLRVFWHHAVKLYASASS